MPDYDNLHPKTHPTMLSTFRSHLMRFPSIAGAFQTLTIKIVGAALALVMFNLLARSMGEADFGALAMWFNVASFLAVVAVFGQDTLIVRSWSQYGNGRDPGRARGAYGWGWMLTVGAAGVTAALLAGSVWAGVWPLAPADMMVIVCFLVAQTLLHYSSHSCRTIAGFLPSELNRELTWRSVVLLAIAAALFLKHPVSDVVFFGAAAVGMVLAVFLQIRVVFRVFPAEIRAAPPRYEPAAWARTGVGMWSSAILEAASQYIDVVLLGLMLHPVAAGGYFVAMRIANIFPMIGAGLHSFLASRMAAHFYDGNTAELQRTIRHVMALASVMVLGLLLVVIVLGRDVLHLFGAEYAAMYPALLLLAFGTGFATLAGPCSVLLLTTGHERLYFRATLAAFILRLALFALLVPLWGAEGAALSWVLAAVPWAVALVLYCRLRLRVDPSVCSLFIPVIIK